MSHDRLYDVEGLVLYLRRAAAGVDAETVVLVLLGLLERHELAVHHRVLHVVALAGPDPLHQRLLVGVEVDEVHRHILVVVGGDADDITVLVLERRAGEHDARPVGERRPLDGLFA